MTHNPRLLSAMMEFVFFCQLVSVKSGLQPAAAVLECPLLAEERHGKDEASKNPEVNESQIHWCEGLKKKSLFTK